MSEINIEKMSKEDLDNENKIGNISNIAYRNELKRRDEAETKKDTEQETKTETTSSNEESVSKAVSKALEDKQKQDADNARQALNSRNSRLIREFCIEKGIIKDGERLTDDLIASSAITSAFDAILRAKTGNDDRYGGTDDQFKAMLKDYHDQAVKTVNGKNAVAKSPEDSEVETEGGGSLDAAPATKEEEQQVKEFKGLVEDGEFPGDRSFLKMMAMASGDDPRIEVDQDSDEFKRWAGSRGAPVYTNRTVVQNI